MRIIGRANDPGSADHDRNAPDYLCDLIVQMTREEWEHWRALTGPSPDGNLVLTSEHVKAVVSMRYAMERAAQTMGMKFVPIEDPARSENA